MGAEASGEGAGTVHTPEIFIRAADWAHARDFGCPAGIGLRRVLLELTGPPRVGACTLHAPVPLPASWKVREVTVTWPATNPGADIVVFIHPDPLPAAVRSRIALGPQEIIVVAQLPTQPPFSADLLPEVRARLLHGELRALAARHPDLADELLALAGPAPTITRTPRVAVISPDPDISVELPGIRIVEDAHVDAVLAVAPPGGWTAADHPTLADAARRAGRLVSTAPLPPDIPGLLVPPGRPPAQVVRHALTLPAVPLPAPRPGSWLRAAEQLERRRRVLLDAHLTDLVTRRAVGELAQLTQDRGLPPSPSPQLREQLGQALVIAFVVGLAAGRAVWTTGPLLGVTAGLLAALAAGGLRWRRGCREAQSRWAAAEATRLRRAPGNAPAVWLRRTLAEELT